MNHLQQSKELLRQYLAVKNHAPWVASYAENKAREALFDLNGLGAWRTDYPTTTYFYPVRIGDGMVDLSTADAVRQHYGVDQ